MGYPQWCVMTRVDCIHIYQWVTKVRVACPMSEFWRDGWNFSQVLPGKAHIFNPCFSVLSKQFSARHLVSRMEKRGHPSTRPFLSIPFFYRWKVPCATAKLSSREVSNPNLQFGGKGRTAEKESESPEHGPLERNQMILWKKSIPFFFFSVTMALDYVNWSKSEMM